MARLGKLLKTGDNLLSEEYPGFPTRWVIWLTRPEDVLVAALKGMPIDKSLTARQQISPKALGMIGPYVTMEARNTDFEWLQHEADVLSGRNLIEKETD